MTTIPGPSVNPQVEVDIRREGGAVVVIDYRALRVVLSFRARLTPRQLCAIGNAGFRHIVEHGGFSRPLSLESIDLAMGFARELGHTVEQNQRAKHRHPMPF